MKRPVCVFCLFAVLTQLAFVCLPQAAVWLLAAGCVFIAAAWWLCSRRSEPLLVCFAILTGIVLFIVSEHRLRLPVQVLSGETAAITAVVEQTEPSYEDGMVDAVLRVKTVDGMPHRFKAEGVSIPQCQRGDWIEAEVIFSDYPNGAERRNAYADGIFIRVSVQSGYTVLGQQWPVELRLRQLGEWCSGQLRRCLSAEEGAVLSAMVTGDRRFLGAELTEVYRRAGVSHLLVVSGLHLTLLCGLVPLSRQTDRRSRVIRAIGSILLAFLLMGIVGFSPSILRAGIAVLILHMSTLFYEPADSLTSLALAVFGMSAVNAYAVCDLSLQLSATATAGVIAAAEIAAPFVEKLFARDHFWCDRLATLLQAAAVSAGAIVFTFPVLVLWRMNVSAVALLANLAVSWLAVPILFFGVLAIVCSALPVLNWFYPPLVLMAALFVKLMNRLTGWFAQLPFSGLHFAAPYAAVAATVILLCLFLLRRRKVRWKQTVCCAAVLIAVAVAAGGILSRNVVRAELVGNSWSPAVVVTRADQAVVLYRGGSSNDTAVLRFLRQRGIETAELVIDLRYSSQDRCPIPANRLLVLREQPKGYPATVPCSGVNYTLINAGSGGSVVLDLGGVTAAVVSGSGRALQDIRVNLLFASSGTPGPIKSSLILAANKKYTWLDSTTSGKVYYGQDGLGIEVRPHTSVRIVGAERWR